MSKQTFVIAGASLGGAKAADELRACGFEGAIVRRQFAGDEPRSARPALDEPPPRCRTNTER